MIADDAHAEAWKRYDSDRIIDDRTGEEVPHDDWGYADSERQAFMAGAEWQVSRPFTEEDVEAARREALADAWDEGALWAAVETGAIRDERNDFLAPGDNPYRTQQEGTE